MHLRFFLSLALTALTPPALAAGTPVERLAEQRLIDEMRCTRAPQPVALVRWLLRNGLVRSVGPGADGIATLIPTRPLTLLGHQILYLEAWGAEEDRSGHLVSPRPFAPQAGAHMQFIAVLLQGIPEEIEPLVRRQLPRASIQDHSMQVTAVICTDLDHRLR